MKLSLSLPDYENHSNGNPILKAKLPITIFNQPFTSILSTPTNSFSDLSFALSTNFPSGPSLKFTYSPSSPTSAIPFSLSLKSGLGLFGSPHNSPLVFSANFSLSGATPNAIVPAFSLHFKPQLGHFSLHKRTSPDPDSNSETQLVSGSQLNSISSSNSEFGSTYAPDGQLSWQEVKLETFPGKEKLGLENPDTDGVYAPNIRQLMLEDRKKGGIFRGVDVKARTELPLNKRFQVNLRWDLKLPGDLGTKMPCMTVNKIGLVRIEEVKKVKEKSHTNNAGDTELLKGMFFWMKRDLENIEKENKDMKESIEEMRSRGYIKNSGGAVTGAVMNRVPASINRLGELEQWRRKKNEVDVQTESERPVNSVSDLESELQRAIKAAAA